MVVWRNLNSHRMKTFVKKRLVLKDWDLIFQVLRFLY